MPRSCDLFKYGDLILAVTWIVLSGEVGGIQAAVRRIQDAAESVCSFGCMKRVFLQEDL